jgi:Tfp pilus assembly protein PilE
MQRRKVDLLVNGDEKGNGSLGIGNKLIGRRAPSSRKSRGISSVVVVVVLVGALVMIGAVSFLSPRVQDAEMTTARKTKDLVHNAFKIEQEMEKQVGDFLHHKQEPPVVATKQKSTAEATAAMEKQPSSWVDGEKRLKEKLKVLYEKQKNGKELGVPVLTRYLGEDIPAWAGEGVNEVEWRKQVDAKYKEMAKQEKQWRETMKALDERSKGDTSR